jgi:hypothetical protein
MNANKVTVKIEMESLHIDVLRGMLGTVAEQVESGAESGHLEMDDGDCIKWSTTRTPVSF